HEYAQSACRYARWSGCPDSGQIMARFWLGVGALGRLGALASVLVEPARLIGLARLFEQIAKVARSPTVRLLGNVGCVEAVGLEEPLECSRPILASRITAAAAPEAGGPRCILGRIQDVAPSLISSTAPAAGGGPRLPPKPRQAGAASLRYVQFRRV